MQRMPIYPRPWKVPGDWPFSRSFSQQPSSSNHGLFSWQPGQQCHRRYVGTSGGANTLAQQMALRSARTSAIVCMAYGKAFDSPLQWLLEALATRLTTQTRANRLPCYVSSCLTYDCHSIWKPCAPMRSFCVWFSAEGTKSNRSCLYGFFWMWCYCIGFLWKTPEYSYLLYVFLWKTLKKTQFCMCFCGRRWII